MLATKFNVKLNQLFILIMRKEFYSDQIYLIRFDSSKSFHWSRNERDRLTNKEIGRS